MNQYVSWEIQMKTLLSLLVCGLFSVPVFADESHQDLHFMKNFDKRIQALENYSVTFVEPGKGRNHRAVEKSSDTLVVKLIPKGKS